MGGECCGECKSTDKPIEYTCDCPGCEECSVIGFDKVPDAIPYCCGKAMKRTK